MNSQPARLIIDAPHSGAWNMAVDQALLESAEETGATTFRIYFWEPATVSLGYFQKFAERNDHDSSKNCPIVRRKTGGGAIVHDHEITYSLCIPSRQRWSKRNRELYDLVHQTIIDSLAEYSILAHLCDPKTETQNHLDSPPFLCFLRRAKGDLMLGTDKVGGSAQRRLKNSLLQHGSLLFQRSGSAPELPGINDLAKTSVIRKEFLDCWVEKVSNCLSLELYSDSLTEKEKETARKVQEGLFSTSNWTENR